MVTWAWYYRISEVFQGCVGFESHEVGPMRGGFRYFRDFVTRGSRFAIRIPDFRSFSGMCRSRTRGGGVVGVREVFRWCFLLFFACRGCFVE